MKTVLLIAILGLGSTAVTAQIKRFRWTIGSGQCEIEGTYNSAKYTETQLKNTVEMFQGFTLSTYPYVFKYEDIKTLPGIAALDKEYETKSATLKNLQIIKSAYWETVRQRKLKELEQVYKLNRATMRGYRDPSALREYPFADSCVRTYAEPLIAGGEKLLATWRNLNEESRKRNGNPERMRSVFNEQFNSPDKYNYALVEIMAFGWFNCANDQIERVSPEVESKNFQKLFIRTRTRCEEP